MGLGLRDFVTGDQGLSNAAAAFQESVFHGLQALVSRVFRGLFVLDPYLAMC